MGFLADLLFGLFTSGVGRTRGRTRFARPPRPRLRVHASPWITVGMVAITAQGIVLAVVMLLVLRLVIDLANDDLFFVLGIILLPLAIGGLGVVLSVLGWMVGVFRKLVDLERSARIDLAISGIAGLLLSIWLAVMVPPAFGLLFSLPSALAVLAAAVPGGWRDASDIYPFEV